MASYTVSQSAGTATITVVRSSDGVAASVAYATSDGTAKAGVDYVTASGVLSFAAGQSVETFTVSIINTQQVGGSRFLNLTLSNPTNGMVLGNPSMATLTILGFTTSGPTVLSLQPVLHRTRDHLGRPDLQRAARPEPGRQPAQLRLQPAGRGEGSAVRDPRRPPLRDRLGHV